MDIKEFLQGLANKPMFIVMFCPDSELRPIYVNKFVDAHQGRLVYRDDLLGGKQPRVIGKKPVYVILDWEPGLKKPKLEYSKVTFPTLLLYTGKGPSESVKTVYGEHIVEIPPVTGEQATNLLSRLGLPFDIIDFLKAKTSGTQEAILLGKQVLSLSEELNLSVNDCFNSYFKLGLEGRNTDEEPTELLDSMLSRNYRYIFNYLLEQRGNELFVFGCILNWLEDLIKFCSCNGDYWNDAGLVSAKYKPFKQAGVNRVPFIQWIKVYEFGLHMMHSIKINEPDPGSALEVFICRIIQTLM